LKTWVRLYTALPSNRKVQSLPPILFKFWVNCLAFAGQNDGELPLFEDIAWELREKPRNVENWMHALVMARLVEVEDGGAEDLQIYRMHDWKEHQYEFGKTPTPEAERMRKLRERRANSSRTVRNNHENGLRTVTEPSESVSVLYSDSVKSKPSLHDPPIPREELDAAWERHKNYSGKESQQVVFQLILSMNGTFDVERFRERHESWCEHWAAQGWNAFGSLTFWGWIQAGMPEPPPEPERRRRR